MSTEIAVAFITGVLGPVSILIIKYYVEKSKKKPDMIAETLVRRYGYHDREITDFLSKSLTTLGLTRESEIAQNLYQDSSYLKTELRPFGESTSFKATAPALGNKPLISKFNDLVPLPARETFFDGVFRSRLLSKVNRPFVRVWRLRGK